MKILELKLICADDYVETIEDAILDELCNFSMLEGFFLSDSTREATPKEIQEGVQILEENAYDEEETERWLGTLE